MYTVFLYRFWSSPPRSTSPRHHHLPSQFQVFFSFFFFSFITRLAAVIFSTGVGPLEPIRATALKSTDSLSSRSHQLSWLTFSLPTSPLHLAVLFLYIYPESQESFAYVFDIRNKKIKQLSGSYIYALYFSSILITSFLFCLLFNIFAFGILLRYPDIRIAFRNL